MAIRPVDGTFFGTKLVNAKKSESLNDGDMVSKSDVRGKELNYQLQPKDRKFNMKGKVLGFDQANNSGVISGEDGKRYAFDFTEWKSNYVPQPGVEVDFVSDSDTAKEVYAVSGITDGTSKKIGAALFAFFLGAFGAHKFYLGYKKQGWIMLITSFFGFILLGIPTLIMGLIAFIEAILYAVKPTLEFEKVYVLGRRPWF